MYNKTGRDSAGKFRKRSDEDFDKTIHGFAYGVIVSSIVVAIGGMLSSRKKMPVYVENLYERDAYEGESYREYVERVVNLMPIPLVSVDRPVHYLGWIGTIR